MPKINLSVQHNLGQDEAKNRITSLLADARNRFGGQISNVAESWNGYTDAFSFDAMGFSAKGTLDVQPAQVLIELNLPFAAYPFKGRIENEILTQARQLLG
jgi:Putative polyhydroxyalkanoic acid system protein (PHA_gran_rgn)